MIFLVLLILIFFILLILLIFLVLFLIVLLFVFLLLIVLFVLLLILLLLLLFEFLEQFLYEVPVFLGGFVFGIELEGFVVVLDGARPIRLLRRGFLCGFPAADERVGEVVGGVFAELLVLGEEGFGEVSDGLREVAELVGGGTGIELEFTGIRGLLEAVLEVLFRILEVAAFVGIKSVCGGMGCWGGHQDGSEQDA